MGTGAGPSFGHTKGHKLYAGDASFMNSNDRFLQSIRRRKDVDPDGRYDIIAHGTSESLKIEHNGKTLFVNWRTAAKLIQNSPGYHKGQSIRLLSCNTGYLNHGFAQNLANKLNVTVYAPTRYLWTDSHGNHFIAGKSTSGEPNFKDRGRFRAFHPERR